jgi:hypothetical protein
MRRLDDVDCEFGLAVASHIALNGPASRCYLCTELPAVAGKQPGRIDGAAASTSFTKSSAPPVLPSMQIRTNVEAVVIIGVGVGAAIYGVGTVATLVCCTI